MANKKAEIHPGCEYCIHNIGVGKLGYMWYCEILGYCIPFGWHRCEAEYLHKGKFEIDNQKLNSWEKMHKK